MMIPLPAVPVAPRIRRLLLATDLSSASELATDWAFELAREHRAELLVVSVVDGADLPGPGRQTARRADQAREARERAALALVARGRAETVSVNFLVWTGDPGESIVDAALAEDVDLVLVGSHGRGQLGRLLLGSVSDHVVRHAPCPVLVVRATVRPDDATRGLTRARPGSAGTAS